MPIAVMASPGPQRQWFGALARIKGRNRSRNRQKRDLGHMCRVSSTTKPVAVPQGLWGQGRWLAAIPILM